MRMQIDGQQTDLLRVDDRGLLYGDGLFETMRWQRGRLQYKTRHLRRLLDGADRLCIALDSSAVERQLDTFLAGLPEGSDALIKLIVTRGSGGRGYSPTLAQSPRIILQQFPLPADLAERARNGILCGVSTIMLARQPLLAGIKHLNRLEQVLASAELDKRSALQADLRELLMCDDQQNVVEGTRSNLFYVTGDNLYTPPLDVCGVSGVMREVILGHCATRGINCRERTLQYNELGTLQELFVCNSVIGIWPVRMLELSDASHHLSSQHYARMLQSDLNRSG